MIERDIHTQETYAMIEALLSKVPQLLQSEVAHAVQVALRQHEGQLRFGGKPYVTHVLAVADKAVDYATAHALPESGARILIISAFLHDVVEDTGMTIEDITEFFGNEVADVVAALTHEDEDEPNEVYLARVAAGGPLAIVIKRCDKMHNLESLAEAPESFRVEKIAELEAEIGLWRSFDPETADMFEDWMSLQ